MDKLSHPDANCEPLDSNQPEDRECIVEFLLFSCYRSYAVIPT